MCVRDNDVLVTNGLHHSTLNRANTAWWRAAKIATVSVALLAILIGSLVHHPHFFRVTRALYNLSALPENDWNDYYKSLDVMRKPILTTKDDELLGGAWYKVR